MADLEVLRDLFVRNIDWNFQTALKVAGDEQDVFSSPSILEELKLTGVADYLDRHLQGEISACTINFSGPVSGAACLLIPKASCEKILKVMYGDGLETTGDIDWLPDAVCEFSNRVLSSVVGAMANSFGFALKFESPNYSDSKIETITQLPKSLTADYVTLVSKKYKFEKLQLDGEVVLFFESKLSPLAALAWRA